jgi:hypothetical protein
MRLLSAIWVSFAAAGALNDAALMRGESRVDQVAGKPPESRKGAPLVDLTRSPIPSWLKLLGKLRRGGCFKERLNRTEPHGSGSCGHDKYLPARH